MIMNRASIANTVGLLLTLAANASATEQGSEQDLSLPVEASLPIHLRLAYRPDKPISLLDLPKEFMAVQLLAVSSKEALQDYARTHGLQGMSAARVAAQAGQLRYVLLLGIYENRELAQRAIKDLPPPLNVLDVWIRPMGSLQQAIIAGDDLARTSFK